MTFRPITIWSAVLLLHSAFYAVFAALTGISIMYGAALASALLGLSLLKPSDVVKLLLSARWPLFRLGAPDS
jgi:hypothetical protein